MSWLLCNSYNKPPYQTWTHVFMTVHVDHSPSRGQRTTLSAVHSVYQRCWVWSKTFSVDTSRWSPRSSIIPARVSTLDSYGHSWKHESHNWAWDEQSQTARRVWLPPINSKATSLRKSMVASESWGDLRISARWSEKPPRSQTNSDLIKQRRCCSKPSTRYVSTRKPNLATHTSRSSQGLEI